MGTGHWGLLKAQRLIPEQQAEHWFASPVEWLHPVPLDLWPRRLAMTCIDRVARVHTTHGRFEHDEPTLRWLRLVSNAAKGRVSVSIYCGAVLNEARPGR